MNEAKANEIANDFKQLARDVKRGLRGFFR